MLVIYVVQFLGLIVNGVRQNLITDQITSTVVSTGDREVLNSIQGFFFVALANSAERDLTVKPVASKPSEDVFTVSNKDMSPQRNRYSNSTNGTGRRRYSENSVKGKIPVTYNKVEYNFDFTKKYEKQSDQSLINVKGNLRKNSLFWKNVLLANDFIMNVINFGYRIPFDTLPTPIILKNNMSSLKHANFVENSITELFDKHCITEVTHPFIVIPITVSVSGSGKER